MPGASHTIEVDLPPRAFYGLVTSFDAYPEFVSDIRGAKVLRHLGDTWDVWFKAHVITDIEYTLRLTGEPGARLTWTLLESPIMSGNTGGWELEDIGGGRTRATYSVELVLNRLVPGSVTRMLVQARLPAMLQDWVRRSAAIAAEGARKAPKTPKSTSGKPAARRK